MVVAPLKSVSYVTLSCAISWSSFADTGDHEHNTQLSELSFDELFELEVTVASKNAQTLKDAPSTVTVFTRSQIENMAVESVYDLLNYVPGFQIARGDWVGALPKEHARGVFLDNGYVLFLINGERLNELSFGKASVYSPFISLNIVERVEVIRGPGSALYGSNAFMGVVNVITRTDENWVKLGVGENSAKNLSVGWHYESGDTRINFVSDWREADGNSYQYQGEATTDPYQHGIAQVTLDYKSLNITARYSQSDLEKFINLGGASDVNFHFSENRSISASYDFELTDATILKAKAYLIKHEIESSGKAIDSRFAGFISNDFFVGPFWFTEDKELSLDLSHQFFAGGQLNLGIATRKSEQTQAGTATSHFDFVSESVIPADDFYLGQIVSFASEGQNARSPLLSEQDTTSFYAQYQFSPIENLSLNIGGRYDDVDPIDKNFSPRFALNYAFNEEQNFKVQYGEAFRTPVTNELFSEDVVTVGNPNLKPELIETLEFVWMMQTSNTRWELVYFDNELKGFVNKVPLPNSLTQFTFDNDINKSISGIEFSHSYRFASDSELFINYTNISDEPINPSYRRFGSFGWRFVGEKWRANIDANWRGSLNVGNDFNHGSYLVWGSKLHYAINEELSLSLSAYNLFDKEFHVYEPRVSGSAMPGRGRETWLSLQYQFH